MTHAPFSSAEPRKQIPFRPRFLLLTASLAFASAFLVARRLGPPSTRAAFTLPAAPTADGASHQPSSVGDLRPPTDSPAEGGDVFRDPLLRAALSATDLASAVALIMARENEDQCADTRLLCLVENLASHRLAELPSVLQANESNDFVTRHLLTAWAHRDGEAALAWLQSRTGVSDAHFHCVLLGWSRAEPDAALAWLDRQPPTARTGTLQTALVEAMAEKDPSAALELMTSRGWLDRSPSAMVRVLQNWGGTDLSAALQGLREISESLGLQLKTQGTDTVTELHQSKQSYRVLLGALLHGAFQRSPQEASALVALLSPEELANGAQAIQQEVLSRHQDAPEPAWPPGTAPKKSE
jgi:hypothetical protein